MSIHSDVYVKKVEDMLLKEYKANAAKKESLDEGVDALEKEKHTKDGS